MKTIVNFIRLIRLPNVLIIVLCQYLLRFGLLKPVLFRDHPGAISPVFDFTLLVIATVLLCVGGYLINDYFDVKIDSVNRPGRNRVGKEIRIRTIVIAHLSLNFIAIVIGGWLGYRLHSLNFALIFPAVSVLLWLYSVRYKRRPIWGNLVVALLSALVIFMVWCFEFLYLRRHPSDFAALIPQFKAAGNYFFAYGLIGFLVSLFREIIKDLEDVPGDSAFGCRTLPIAYGTGAAKHFVAILAFCTFLILAYGEWILFERGRMLVFLYFLLLVEMPLVLLIIRIYRAKTREDYHFLSNLSKLIMFAGIISIPLVSYTI